MKLKITVHGVAYEVEVEVLDPGEGFSRRSTLPHAKAQRPASGPLAQENGAPPAAPAGRRNDTNGNANGNAAGGDANGVQSPIAGTIVEVHCKVGQSVAAGDELMIIEAMKMNTSITAPSAGTVKAVGVAAGDSVREGESLVEFE
jgi:glutaconyl-CoA/methylmalonyl-CoA decarboxylase subunit gamma